MKNDALAQFASVVLVDFEFQQSDGERPEPLCMVAREWRTGQTVRLWQDELLRNDQAPFSVGTDTLLVAYFATAELGCFLSRGWPQSVRILDLYPEFRCRTSGLITPCGNSLLGALAYFGLDGTNAAEQGMMRDLAQRGGPYTPAERVALLEYCESDVSALGKLLSAMLPKIDLGRALLRGRSMAAVARMERIGIPIDVEALHTLRDRWGDIQDGLIRQVDQDYRVYDGRSFRADRFAEYLDRNGIPWPRLPSGTLALDDAVFKEMSRVHPRLASLRELRVSLSGLRLESLAVGRDGRNRTLLSPFSSKTGRNQPSNARYIFGPSVWLRGLIRPERDWALAYVDWEQQEFGIAGALSHDMAMMAAYMSGDPYLAFARQAGAVPADATKQTHADIREQFKVCALAVQYGMGERSLAQRLGVSPARARELLQLHRRTYPTYWSWSQAAVDHGMLYGYLQTVFGWRVHVGIDANPRSLANFPMQANGAEMLRLACCLATERGIQVCGPVHDALLVEAALTDIDRVAAETQAAMREASEVVLDGFPLRTDCRIVRWPHRYMDEKRGRNFWDTVWKILEELPLRQHGAPPTTSRGAPRPT
jgi:DNA polymerase I